MLDEHRFGHDATRGAGPGGSGTVASKWRKRTARSRTAHLSKMAEPKKCSRICNSPWTGKIHTPSTRTSVWTRTATSSSLLPEGSGRSAEHRRSDLARMLREDRKVVRQVADEIRE